MKLTLFIIATINMLARALTLAAPLGLRVTVANPKNAVDALLEPYKGAPAPKPKIASPPPKPKPKPKADPPKPKQEPKPAPKPAPQPVKPSKQPPMLVNLATGERTETT
jgi:outer membrane biosynthesis protein TonB